MTDQDKLREMIRFDLEDYSMFEGVEDDTEREYPEMPSFDGEYMPVWQDLKCAMENLLKKNISTTGFVNWFAYLTDDLCECYHRAFDLPDIYFGMIVPENDTDMFRCLWYLLGSLYEICIGYEDIEPASCEEFRENLYNTLDMVEDYENNRDNHDVIRQVTPPLVTVLINEYYSLREQVPEHHKKLMRMIVEIGVEKNYDLCLEIHAYACFFGDSIFERDPVAAESSLLKCFEAMSLQAKPDRGTYSRFSGMLGDLYFNGDCNDGVPEYEKAFGYYVISSHAGMVGGRFRVAQMLGEGLGVPKSVYTSNDLFREMHWEMKKYAQFKEYPVWFSEVTIRTGTICRMNGKPREGLQHYLEGQYFLKKVLEVRNTEVEREILEQLENGIEAAKSEIGEDYFPAETEVRIDGNDIYGIMRTFIWERIHFDVEQAGENRYRVTLKRPKYKRVLYAILPLTLAQYRNTLVFYIYTENGAKPYDGNLPQVNVNDVKYDEKSGKITFLMTDRPVLKMDDTKIYVSREDYDGIDEDYDIFKESEI